MESTYINYLNDSIKQLIELAYEIRNTENLEEFEIGKIHGIYMAISRLLNQAEAFGILESLDKEISNFEPESLL